MVHVFVVSHTDMETDSHITGASRTKEGAEKMVAELFEYISEEKPVGNEIAANETHYTGSQLRVIITELELSE